MTTEALPYLRQGALSSWGEAYLSTTIYPLCIRYHQFQLLGKLREPAAGISGCCDKHFWVPLASMSVLIIYVRPGHCCVVILKLYVMPQRLLFLAQLCWNWLALCNT